MSESFPMKLSNDQLDELKLSVESKLNQALEQWRAESVVVDTRKDPQMREHLDKVYAATKAGNRLHANGLTQRQQHRQAYSKELKDHVDLVLGGQHALQESLNSIHTWLFHDGQQLDQHWQVLLNHIIETEQFRKDQQAVNETIMAFINKQDPKLLEKSPADQRDSIW